MRSAFSLLRKWFTSKPSEPTITEVPFHADVLPMNSETEDGSLAISDKIETEMKLCQVEWLSENGTISILDNIQTEWKLCRLHWISENESVSGLWLVQQEVHKF